MRQQDLKKEKEKNVGTRSDSHRLRYPAYFTLVPREGTDAESPILICEDQGCESIGTGGFDGQRRGAKLAIQSGWQYLDRHPNLSIHRERDVASASVKRPALRLEGLFSDPIRSIIYLSMSSSHANEGRVPDSDPEVPPERLSSISQVPSTSQSDTPSSSLSFRDFSTGLSVCAPRHLFSLSLARARA